MKTRSRIFRKIACIGLAVTMVLSLSACGGGNTDENATLVVGAQATSRCFLDPHKTTDYGDYNYLNQTGDTLVVTDFDGQTIKGGLAEKWDVSEDGLKYTFKIKDNVKFHSGKKLTAADVKWTYERWGKPETASPTGHFVKNIKSIEAPDDTTVIINMSQPDPNLLINLTVPVAVILNKDVVEKAEAEGKVYGSEVVDGTGPFIFDKYVENDSISFVRNDDYAWAPEIFENDGAAHVKELKIRFLPETTTRMMEFQGGNVDILGNSCVAATEIKNIEKEDYVKIAYFEPPFPAFVQFQLNRVTDINVRRACNMAIDRKELIDTCKDGICEPLLGAFPSNYEWYWKGSDDYYKYDVKAANKLLEDDGWKMGSDGYRYKDGKKLSFNILFGTQEDQMIANMLQAQYKKIGLDLVVDMSHYNDFWDYINTNDWDSICMELTLNTPEDMLYEYMSSDNIPYPNRQSYSDPQTDAWLNEAKTTMDKKKRKELYDKIQEKALEEAIWIPVYNTKGFITYNSRVKNFKPHPTIIEGIPKLIDVEKES